MTHHEATAILNRVREGQQFSHFVITRALELTGDYEGDGSAGVGAEIPQESERPWENESIRMVVNDLIRHSEKAWIKRR
jgi:hypothetical protein